MKETQKKSCKFAKKSLENFTMANVAYYRLLMMRKYLFADKSKQTNYVILQLLLTLLQINQLMFLFYFFFYKDFFRE